MSKHARAVLLDVDGTLVDSNEFHARAWVEGLAQHGYDTSFERVSRMIGMGSDKLVPELTNLRADSEQAKAIGESVKLQFMGRFLPQVRAFAQTRALLETLRDDGYRLAVATSSSEEQLHAILERAGIRDLIEHETNADDADNSKPDPDIVQTTLHKLGLEASEAIMLGDTPYDVQAATRAGVPIVGLRCGGWSARELRGAVAVYADPADLLRNYADSTFRAHAPWRRAGAQVEQ
jgi:HAD superfamily hydrolase (TIGR01509 family)